VIVSCEGDRSTDAPRGIRGGLDGIPGRITHVRSDGTIVEMYSKFSGYRIPAGDTLRIEAPLAGGYGRPLGRDAALVQGDVADGYLSVADARDAYAVVCDESSGAVDVRATASLRSARAAGDGDNVKREV
jgi:N-methylhydantoinase B